MDQKDSREEGEGRDAGTHISAASPTRYEPWTGYRQALVSALQLQLRFQGVGFRLDVVSVLAFLGAA